MDVNIRGKSPKSLLKGIGNYLLEQSRVLDDEPMPDRSVQEDTHGEETDEDEEGTYDSNVSKVNGDNSLNSSRLHS